MTKNKIIVLREGINSTFQDLGRNNFYHIGLPFSGAMDKRNYLIANKLVGNQHNEAVIEFAYQGPLLKIEEGNINFAISGDVKFNIKKDDKLFNGQCYKTYFLSKTNILFINLYFASCFFPSSSPSSPLSLSPSSYFSPSSPSRSAVLFLSAFFPFSEKPRTESMRAWAAQASWSGPKIAKSSL